jgi:DNA-binding NarL/FixJ family response regulator
MGRLGVQVGRSDAVLGRFERAATASAVPYGAHRALPTTGRGREEDPIAVRQRPTRRQVEVLRAYIAAGSVAVAAYELGITETTARQHLSGLYRRTGVANVAQAAYLLGKAATPRPDNGTNGRVRAGLAPPEGTVRRRW